MTTYDTYQEAKIANPKGALYKINEKFTRSPSCELGFALQPANPADHYMTVEDFLASGHKFDEGDLILDEGALWICSDTTQLTIYVCNIEAVNTPEVDDDYRYVIRAEALNKPKRTKVEYVECDNLQDSLDKFESMLGFEFYSDEDGAGDRINSVRRLALAYGNGSLYRRIEIEIDERQEFIDSYVEAAKVAIPISTTDWAGILYDSGKFKLVEGE